MRFRTMKPRTGQFKVVVLFIGAGATSIRRTFKSSKNAKLFNASKEFHISEYFHLVILCGE